MTVTRSARGALFWASIVLAIDATLYLGIAAAEHACGWNKECFVSYLKSTALIHPHYFFALLGVLVARARPHLPTGFVRASDVFCLVVLFGAALGAFAAVNFPFARGIEANVYRSCTALLASQAIIAAVISVASRREPTGGSPGLKL